MRELELNEVESINGGMDFYNWAMATSAECAAAAALTAELPPVGVALAAGAAVTAAAAAVYSAWN